MTKYLNLDLDQTLGGSSPSDYTIPSQKAIKAYVDGLKTDWYGTCSTAASTQTKVVDCSGFVLTTGASVRVKFTYAQTYSSTVKLNVNSTGAINIMYDGSHGAQRNEWVAGEVVSFTYDGTYWMLTDGGHASYSSYGNTILTDTIDDTTYKAVTPNGVYLALQGKQDTLESGTNIKTINNQSILGSGNIDISGGGGDLRNIGEIVQSTIPLTDAGLHLLDGSLISGSGSYADFVTYISGLVSTYPSLFTTEANWQTSNTNYGACDKYVYDSINNTVRLPKRTTEHGALIKSYSDGSDWYRIYSDGWCEQGGSVNISGTDNNNTVYFLKSFVNTNYSVSEASYGNTDRKLTLVTLHTDRMIVKGWDNTSLWQACGYTDISDYQYSSIYEYVVMATSTKTSIEVDIDEVMTDLNGKTDVDFGNMNPSATAKETIVGWGMPDYSNPVTLGVTTYTATANGWVKVNMDVYDGVISVSINGSEIATGGGNYSNNDQKIFPVKSGDTITTNSTNRILLFFPCIGG